MATKFDSTLKPTTGDATMYRAWMQFIHDAVVSFGWVQTGDTGQLDIATAPVPTTTNTRTGYRAYRMDDALQATKPCFMRLDFGNTNGLANPALSVSLGTGTNGGGTLTGKFFEPNPPGGAPMLGTAAASTTQINNCYASGDPSRLQLAMFVSTSTSFIFAFSIERSKDASGADTGDAFIVVWHTPGTGLNRMQFVAPGGVVNPPVETGLSYVLSTANPSAFGSDIGVGVPIPLRGTAQQPGTGVAIVRSNDFVVESQFTMQMYGQTRTYVHLNALQAVGTNNGADATSRVCARYD